MIDDPVAQALHEKSASGGTLTPEEQERLQRWYAEMNAGEEAMFARARQREGSSTDLEDLQTRIEETNASIVAEAERIQALEKENEQLRREIGSLRRLIAQKKSPQAV